MKKKEAEKKCIELGSRLDEAHEKLQLQISRYAVHLNEFEHVCLLDEIILFVSVKSLLFYRQQDQHLFQMYL